MPKPPQSKPAKSRPAAKRTAKKTAPARATGSAKAARPRRWSQSVTAHSNALTLERDVFKLKNPDEIAASLKRSAERSRRRKASAYGSAMSMLTFYVNRAGRNLPAGQRRVLEQAKISLRRAFGRE